MLTKAHMPSSYHHNNNLISLQQSGKHIFFHKEIIPLKSAF